MLIMDMLKCSVSFLEKVNIVFYRVGINQYNIDKKFNTIHAEVDAANKLPFQQKKVTVDFLVCRINNNGTKFLMAKSCNNCVKTINYILKKKNYKLNRIYYTNQEGHITH